MAEPAGATASNGMGGTGERHAFTGFAYACQFFYGGWFLFHGLNYWFGFYFDRSVLPGPGLVPALAESGVMTIVKLLEIVIGLALLLDRFAALAIVGAWPITLMIAYVNGSHLTRFGLSVSAVIIALNAIMSLGHLDRYRAMLAYHAGAPVLGQGGARPIAGIGHILAAAGGVAAAAGVTYLTLWLLH
ncbi:hypothetical protein ACFQ1E_13535 [Sphingomonas canadensis]|uniref:DoxX family protein n=1 Tax=Sphingomonas canadensis TaxID=1219257 RepID=A0ABW3H791_9SPHN|nr:hypothetical protein [Sphingomonas canadensis]MCW3836979.1 hypothetical protein [Sphingomonas canadensis]